MARMKIYFKTTHCVILVKCGFSEMVVWRLELQRLSLLCISQARTMKHEKWAITWTLEKGDGLMKVRRWKEGRGVSSVDATFSCHIYFHCKIWKCQGKVGWEVRLAGQDWLLQKHWWPLNSEQEELLLDWGFQPNLGSFFKVTPSWALRTLWISKNRCEMWFVRVCAEGSLSNVHQILMET